MSQTENGFRAPLVEELEPLFPSYQILSLIAVGGMGAVYHAVQTALDREVAIKILPAEFGNDEAFCESFSSEAKAMAKLNHPNLISVFDFGEVNEMLFLVMEYMPCKSLHEQCYQSAVAPEEAVRLMVGVCHGLSHAHEQGILHRDIKPANIMLDAKLSPKVGDFGLARPLDSQVQDGEIIYGTPGYTAPEVLETPKQIDQRADIFSLGVLIQELLTGLVPEDEPRSPSSIVGCDPRFDAVVSKATHPHPSQRYQDATEIADALQKIIETKESKLLRAASLISSSPLATQTISKEAVKKGSVGVLVATVLLGLVGLFFWNQFFKNTAEESIPDIPDQVVVKTAPPVEPDPDPVAPDPAPVVVEVEPVPVQPEPEIVEVEAELVSPDPVEVEPEPEPVQPEPEPEPEPEPVVVEEPKYDVEKFFAHAKKVMQDRCDTVIDDHEKALEDNLADLIDRAEALIKRHLWRYIEAATREINDYQKMCEQNGNRVGEELGGKLKFKPYLKELHQAHKDKEEEIDKKMEESFAKQEKTYLYGLGLKVKALEKDDDPLAAEMIKAEIEKVKKNPTYFKDMMMEGRK